MIVDLLLFIALVIFLPYVIVGVLLGTVLVKTAEFFRLPVLFAALSAAGLAALALMNSTPNPDVPYSTVVEVFAQSQVFGVAMPFVCFGIAALLLAASVKPKEARP